MGFFNFKKKVKKETIINEVTQKNNEVVVNEQELVSEALINDKEEKSLDITVLQEQTVKDYVIDSSIANVESIDEKIKEILETQTNNFILTSATIKRLIELKQKKNSIASSGARKILNIAAENPERFENIGVDETVNEVQTVFKYCCDNSQNVILLTSNTGLVAEARVDNLIEVEFLSTNTEQSKIRTLFSTQIIDGKLSISEEQWDKGYRIMQIIRSDGKVINSGNVALEIGDNIFIATKKDNYISLNHFEVLTLENVKNVKSIFIRKVYDDERLEDKLFKREYLDFAYILRNRFKPYTY